MDMRHRLLWTGGISTMFFSSFAAANCDGPYDVMPGQSIQAAIDAASNGEVITVAPGVYHQHVDLMGKAITLDGVNDCGERAILDGSSFEDTVVAVTRGEGKHTVIEGFEIRNGVGRLTGGIRRGGGMYVDGSGPTLRNLVFTNNEAGCGGGLLLASSWSHVFECEFHGNTATQGGSFGGGGVSARGGSVLFDGCRFVDNLGWWAAEGGGLSATGSTARVLNSVFVGNRAWQGGAIRHATGELHLWNCTIVDNTADNSGGGLFLFDSNEVNVVNSILRGNAIDDDFFGGGEFVVPVYSTDLRVVSSNVEGGLVGLDHLQVFEVVGVVDAEAGFVDRAGRDLRLAASSSMRDAGSNDDLLPDYFDWDGDGDTSEPVPFDADRRSRLDASYQTVDIGAFEFDASGEPEPEPGCIAFGDADQNGIVEFNDVLVMLSSWGACAGCPADADQSGTVGMPDVLLALTNWGPCP